MATIQVRIDDNMKADADSLFSALGLDISTAVRMFIAAVLENGGIPFEVKLNSDGKHSAELRAAIARRKAGNRFYSIEECVEAIDEAIVEGASHAAV